jgi:hypothetical protein
MNAIFMNAQKYPKLFQSIQIGMIPQLSHRIVMAPLTRMRAEQPGDIPGSLAIEYYMQRASKGGLIITEATTVAVTGRGYLGAPGIYSDEQVNSMIILLVNRQSSKRTTSPKNKRSKFSNPSWNWPTNMPKTLLHCPVLANSCWSIAGP